MTLEKARVIKGEARGSAQETAGGEPLARRIPAIVMDAHADAARILRQASEAADAMMSDARTSVAEVTRNAARKAREDEIARVTAELMVARVDDEKRAERDLDRTSEIAVLLAERLFGEAIAHEPARVATLARGALAETRGARRIRIEASADDVPVITSMLDELGESGKKVVFVESCDELSRGSLIVHTELGTVDARLAPQLTRLAEALREALADRGLGEERSARR